MSARIPAKGQPPFLSDPCPCGLATDYAQCCARYHAGPLHLQAPDPQALMRSRYCAFAKDMRAYLLDTWHASQRPEEIEPPEPGLKWLGLSVKHAAMTGPDAGVVAFVARFKVGGRAHRLEETSRFVREQGHWYYVDALPMGADPHAAGQ
jgi:SEC-C motif-containing protein